MEKIMEALINPLKTFLMRDFTFIIGGSAVILSFLFAYDRVPTKELPVILYLLGLCFAYAIGYAIQDGFTLLHFVRTKAGLTPHWFGKALYHLFECKKVKFLKVDEDKYEESKEWLYSSKDSERFRANHERIESLKQVGTTIGPCFLISGAILFAKPFLNKLCFELSLSVGVFVIGLILYCLGWLKVTQQAQYLMSRKARKQSQQDSNNS